MLLDVNQIYKMRGGCFCRINDISRQNVAFPVRVTVYARLADLKAGKDPLRQATLTKQGKYYTEDIALGEPSEYDLMTLVWPTEDAQENSTVEEPTQEKPTTARLGDFAMTLNADGSLRVIYEGPRDTILVEPASANKVTLIPKPKTT